MYNKQYNDQVFLVENSSFMAILTLIYWLGTKKGIGESGVKQGAAWRH